MAKVYLGEAVVHTSGDLPQVGTQAPDFTLTGTDLGDIRLEDYRGQNVVLNIFPSVDTPTCQMSVRAFNERAASIDNTVVICVSMDLPFAQARFCSSEGLERVVNGSGFRSSFGDAYGVALLGGPLRGLYARAVVVIDVNGTVVASQLIEQIGSEPDYDAAVEALA